MSNIPRILQTYNVDSSPVNQRLETEILFPVTSSQSGARFVFRRTGILDSNSKLQLQLIAGAGHHFLPVSTGVASLIQNAYLEIGGARVSTMRDLASWKTWLNLAYTNDYKEFIGSVREGLDDRLIGSDNINGATTGHLSTTATEVASELKLTASALTSPNFMLTLGDIIPCLENFRLPLFAISQEVALVLEWTADTQSARYCSRQGQAAAPSTIGLNNLLICADYLYYPGLMENLAMEISSGSGMNHFFYDVLTSYRHEAAGTVDPGANEQSTRTKFQHQIQLGGQKVRSIVAQFRKGLAAQGAANLSAGNGVNLSMGQYVSNTYQNGDRYNLSVNNVPFYALDIENNSLAYTETSKALGSHLNISNNQYTFKNIVGVADADRGSFITDTNPDLTLSNRLFEGLATSDVVASKRWIGIKLSNIRGEAMPVSNLPILFKHNYSVQGGNAAQGGNLEWQQPTNLRFFAEVSRVLNIRGGVAQLINV